MFFAFLREKKNPDLFCNYSLTAGWPNTYTFTKALAEDLAKHESVGLPFGIFRPSVGMFCSIFFLFFLFFFLLKNYMKIKKKKP